MVDLESQVPPHEPAEDALATVGRMGLGLVPLLGPMIAETLTHALSSRQAARQHAFNVLLASELTALTERLDGAINVEDIVVSDEFVAAVTRASRLASETASESKRRRLAASVANGGAWAPFSATEREHFTRLVEDFDELHIWLLHYFADPRGWLDAHGLQNTYTDVHIGSIDGPLSAALGSPEGDWRDTVRRSLGDLERAGLGSVPLSSMMTGSGTVQRRTTPVADRFLFFLNDPASPTAEAPGVS